VRTIRLESRTALLIVTITCMALVLAAAWTYNYSPLTTAESWVGLVLLLGTAALWRAWGRRADRFGHLAWIPSAIRLGWILGLLWVVEIGINNYVAPPLPLRDIIDNAFWAVIALGILAAAIRFGFRTDRIAAGIAVGAWSGLVSGLLACLMALQVIVFGMQFLTHDPLNVAEWAERGSGSGAPTMAAYFAYQTLAGAFLHLTVLGVGMGGLLGVVGGIIGKGIRLVGRGIRARQ
jgi:hypothetical protein